MNTSKKHIYLDYNASAPLHPDAWAVMEALLTTPENGAHNASAIHHFGREGQKTIEAARKHIADMVGIPSNQIIFNSGATEGNNTVLQHFAHAYPDEQIIISAIEHPSITDALPNFPNLKTAPVTHDGLICLKSLENLLKTKTSLVSCMHVNNETGSIQNVSELSGVAHKYGALFHCDATQSAGRIPVHATQSGIDFLTLSSHKIGGPQGVGALALGICGQTPTLLLGGGQEKYARAGTHNVAGIAGFGAAANAATRNLDLYRKTLEQLRNKLETQLKHISPNIIIHGEQSQRVANTCFFSLPKTKSQNLLIALDLEGISVSNGSACSSGTVKASKILLAMGQDEDVANSALRISMGWATKESDIDSFLSAWQKIIQRIQPCQK
ncbi:MAG: cysteine desulfurase family protein [Alphaproteobacteria bacterium]